MTEAANDRNVKLKSGSRKKLAVMGVLILGLVGAVKLSPYQLKMTMTESVDHSVFIVNTGKAKDLKIGDYVSVLAPDDPMSGHEYVKLVAGLPGDEVKVEGRDVYVGGIYRGRAKPVSRDGRDLEVVKPGIIPKGEIYLFAPHIDSYDSRYLEIGTVPDALITGTAKPLL